MSSAGGWDEDMRGRSKRGRERGGGWKDGMEVWGWGEA